MELVFIWLVLSFIGLGVTAWLVVRFWRRGKLAPITSKLVAVVVCGSALFGGLGTLIGLVKVSGAVGGESVDPSQKARILAEGISDAMNGTAFSFLVWLPSAIALLVMTKRAKAEPERDSERSATKR